MFFLYRTRATGTPSLTRFQCPVRWSNVLTFQHVEVSTLRTLVESRRCHPISVGVPIPGSPLKRVAVLRRPPRLAAVTRRPPLGHASTSVQLAMRLRYDANGNVTAITPPGKPAHAFAYTPVDLEQEYRPPAIGVPSAARMCENSNSLTRPPRGHGVTFSGLLPSASASGLQSPIF